MDFKFFYEGVTDKLTNVAISGVEALTAPALGLLAVLGAIAIMTKWERYFTGQPFWGEFAVKLIHVGVVAYLIKHWYKFYIEFFKDTAENIGATAAGVDSPLAVPAFLNKYIGQIMNTMGTIWEKFSLTDDSLLMTLIAIFVLCVAIVFIAYMAYEMFTTTYELVIVGGLLVILLPFSVLEYTKEFGTRVYSSLFSMFVKLMVVSFFFYLIGNMSDTMALTVSGSKDQLGENLPSLFTYAISLGFLMFLMRSSKDITASIISGATIHSGNPTGVAARGAAVLAGAAGGVAGRAVGRVLMRRAGAVLDKARGKVFSR